MAFLLCTIFFISGASALVFETLWFHQAGIAFGNSVWASSLVLSGFMGGLALGSWVAIKWGDRLNPPTLAYAILETVIAVTGVSLAVALPSLGMFTVPLLQPFLDVPLVLNVLRLLLAFVFLLIPSAAMGLTLPLLTNALVVHDHNFGRVLGRLYGWNTLGAVVGALLSELVLVEALGIHGAALAAGSLNLLAAASALTSMRIFRGTSPAPTESISAVRQWSSSARWLCAAFLAGFTLLALEVVWFRFLLLYVTALSVSFAVMLAVVLSGISLGGLLASVWLRRNTDAFRHATMIALGAGILCIGSYGLFPTVVAPFGNRALGRLTEVAFVSIPLMFPVAFLSGSLFTLVGAAIRQSWPSAASTTGVLTLANTVGAAIGAFAGGFILLPFAGMESALFILAISYGAIAFLVRPEDRSGMKPSLVVGAIGTYVLSVALFPTGAMATKHLKTAAARWSATPQWRVLDYREGIAETILYVEELFLGRRQDLRLVTNSLSMSSTRFNARRYMKLYAYLPVAVHPNPRSALLISYGVGSTAKALSRASTFEHIEIVDISKDILDMSPVVYPDTASNPLFDPRVCVNIEDGRYFLETTEKTFDLITGEPPPPQIAGVVNLYTQEYFQLLYDRLSEGGMVTYWLPLHSLSDRSAKSIVKAFLNVFSNASLWHGWREDLMLVGSRGVPPEPVSVEKFERQWQIPEIASEMKNVGLEVPEQLGALFIGDAKFLADMTEGIQPLVDNFPKRIVADSVPGQGGSVLFASLRNDAGKRERFAQSELIKRLWPEPLIDRTLPYFDHQRVVTDLIDLAGYPLEKNVRDLHNVIEVTTLTGPALWFLGGIPDIQNILNDLNPNEAALAAWQYQIAARIFSERRFRDAAEVFEDLERHTGLFEVARMFRIYALCLDGNTEAAQLLARESYEHQSVLRQFEAWWQLFEDEYGLRVSAARN